MAGLKARHSSILTKYDRGISKVHFSFDAWGGREANLRLYFLSRLVNGKFCLKELLPR